MSALAGAIHAAGGQATVIGDAALHHGDCLDLVPTIVARHGPFDHVIADPPYEDVLHKAAAKGSVARTDGRPEPRGPAFAGIAQIRNEAAAAMVAASRGWVLAFCLAEGVGAWQAALKAAGAKWDTTLAWVKPDAAPRFNGQGAARGFECIAAAWAGTGHRSWNGGGRRGVFTHLTAKGGHETAKPVDLMMALIALYTRPGDLVCDPFMGSATTGVAALRLGRRFVGIEKDGKHFALARARIAALEAAPMLAFEASEATPCHKGGKATFEGSKAVQASLELDSPEPEAS